MPKDILDELNAEQLRQVFLKYTRRAFHMLPKTVKPSILDIGCGGGAVTIELALLSDGKITGIDIDKNALDKLDEKIKQKGLTNRIHTKHSSFYSSGLPAETFDILWEEGVLHLLDIKKSIKECERLLKPAGFLVMNETINWISGKFDVFADYGFLLTDHFLLPENFWWTDYYIPLEKKIKELYIKYPGSKDLGKLKQYENEITMVKKNPKEFDCGIYIMQKATN